LESAVREEGLLVLQNMTKMVNNGWMMVHEGVPWSS
jgi:hypothetical protein